MGLKSYKETFREDYLAQIRASLDQRIRDKKTLLAQIKRQEEFDWYVSFLESNNWD